MATDRAESHDADPLHILEQHKRWLRTVLYARLQDAAAVDDVFQDIAIKLLGQSAALRNPQKAGPWLYRIALREVLLHRRKLGRQRNHWRQFVESRAADGEAADEVDPLQWMIAEESRLLLREALSELSAQDREILLLKHTENCSYGQIVDRLGLPFDTIVYRLSRARRRLRARILRREGSWNYESRT